MCSLEIRCLTFLEKTQYFIFLNAEPPLLRVCCLRHLVATARPWCFYALVYEFRMADMFQEIIHVKL